MRCPFCNSENLPSRQFCWACGKRLPRCAQCGFINEPDASYCGGCGISLAAGAEDVALAPSLLQSTAAPAQQPPAVPAAGAGPVPVTTLAAQSMEGERRQITVMFCDLVGSTSLSNALDPEDLREVIRAYQATATASIERHAGFIARYMGDGILVYFGYPAASDDDAERAVRTGLDVVAEVSRLRPLPELQILARVGIATGLAVVGDRIGSGMAMEEAVVGRTPNLAARLQGLAEPGGVVISRETRNLVADLFHCRDLGERSLKGFDEPVEVCSVLGERIVDNRFKAIRPSYKRVPLIARERELEQLQAAWQSARDGSRQVVMVRGAPGVGKSRLAEALRDSAAAQDHVVLHYYCAQRFQNTALFPITNQIRESAELKKSDSPDTCLDKLEQLFESSSAEAGADPSQTVPYLASLLSIPLGNRYPPVLVTPEKQRERVFQLLAAKLTSLARDQAVLILFEDLHWIDPTSLQLLQQLIGRIVELPVLLLMTSRLEFDPPWEALPNLTTIELPHLDRDDSLQIIASITGGKALPPAIVQQILAKSDGMPLFVEEITKSVLESNLLQELADRFELTGPLPSFAVPSSLHDSLMARLDRLDSAKKVAQIGAAIGRQFSLDLLTAVSSLSETELRPAIQRLINSDLVECQESEGEQICIFKHALLQDAAHATMLRQTRQHLHGKIAIELEKRANSGVDTSPEVLAHHFALARMPEKTIFYRQQAGILANSRAAYTEATHHFRSAIELLSQLPKSTTRNQLELEIRLYLGLSLSATRGYAAPEVEDTYQRARELSHILADSVDLFPVIRGLCTFYLVRGQLATASELAEQCVRLSERSQIPAHLIEGHTALGYTRFFMGNTQPAKAALERSVQIYRQHQGQELDYPTSQDPAISDLSLLALISWMQGQDMESRRCSSEAIALAVQLKRPFNLAYARCFAAMFHNMRHEPESALAQAEQAIEVSMHYGFDIWVAAGSLHAGIAKAALGEMELDGSMFGQAISGEATSSETIQAGELVQARLAAWQAAGARLNRSFFLAGLAEVRWHYGQLQEALAAVDQAIDHAAQHRERFYDAVLFRLRGELQAEIGGALAEQAEADLLHAIEVAHGQGARMLELEAHASLHEWGLRHGHPGSQREAFQSLYQELAPICAETIPIRKAGRLLEQAVPQS